jgi:hypothetical protein
MSPFKMFRQYTMSDIDAWNIYNGRCPKYALDWSDCQNEEHWGVGHDFIVGNKKELVIDSSLEDGYQSYLYGLREQYKKYINRDVDICCRFEDVLCRWDDKKNSYCLCDGAMELWEAIRFYTPTIFMYGTFSGTDSNDFIKEKANETNKKIELCKRMFPGYSSIIIEFDIDMCEVIYNFDIIGVGDNNIHNKDNYDKIFIEDDFSNVLHVSTEFGIYSDIFHSMYKDCKKIIHTCNRETFRSLRKKEVEIFWEI